MNTRILLLAAPLLTFGACSGSVGDDLASEELAAYSTVSYSISGMS